MKRREFITLVGSAATWPLAARAQQPGGMRRIGVLVGNAESDAQTQVGLAKFSKALQDLGWIVGHNITIDYRWAAADLERMTAFAKELVALKPDLIVASTTPVVEALRRETNTIPIVFVIVADPVGSGFVDSLPRPGGNITGFINVESSLSGKWVELLKEVVPHLSRAALLFNPETAPFFNYFLQPFESAAKASAIDPTTAPVRTTGDIERTFAELGGRQDTGVVVLVDVFTAKRSILDVIISAAARNRVPTIYPYRYMVAAGGLVSYGVDNADLFRRAGDYVDRILKGANPADLPVQLPTVFELAVNLKTAKSLGITIPGTVIARADEVIE